MSAINAGSKVEFEGKSLYIPDIFKSIYSSFRLTVIIDPMGEIFPKYFSAVLSDIVTSEGEVAGDPATRS